MPKSSGGTSDATTSATICGNVETTSGAGDTTTSGSSDATSGSSDATTSGTSDTTDDSNDNSSANGILGTSLVLCFMLAFNLIIWFFV